MGGELDRYWKALLLIGVAGAIVLNVSKLNRLMSWFTGNLRKIFALGGN